MLEWVSPSPGDLPNPGMEPGYPTLQADSLPSEPPVTGQPQSQGWDMSPAKLETKARLLGPVPTSCSENKAAPSPASPKPSFFKDLYLLIFGCVGSSLLCAGFLYRP